MRDNIFNLTEDKSCLLAVTPDRGGSWWAALRPDTPRNFAENAHAFYDCQAAVQEALDPTHDYSFLIEAEIVKENQECSMFYAGSDKSPFGVYAYSDNTIRVYSNLMRPAIDTSSKYTTVVAYSGDTRLQGRHTIELRIEGDAMRVFLDGNEIEHSYTFARTGTATVGLPNCNSGYVYKIQIEDLTTGETVWQASRDELYETNPWPSPVPENFAENAKNFYDYQAVMQEALDPTHDYSFLIEADRVSDRTENFLFYTVTDKLPFGVLYHGDHTIKFFTNLLRNEGDPSGTYASLNFYTGTDWLLGRHQFEARIEGNTITTYVDGVQYATSNKFARTGTAAVGLPQCNSGYVYKIQITDLTDNQVVWYYPSEAERVRLITKTNVRTDRGVFEAADTSKCWSVTTQLRAASLLPECTIIVEADNPNGEAVTFVSCAQRANPTQGFFVIRRQDVGALLFGYSGKNSSGAMVYPNRYIRYPGGKHVFAFVLDYSVLQLRIYIDGAEVDNRAMDVNVVAPPEFDETVKPVILGVTSTSDGLNLTSKISHCLIFDRALTAAEIAAFGVRRLRNFAENLMMWTDAKTALDTIDQSHDFTFEIEFKCVKTNAAYVFASDVSRDFIRVFLSSGEIIVNTALLSTSSGGSIQFSAGSDLTNPHVLTVKFTGNTITASVDSEVVYTRENLFRNVIEISTPYSNAGYVYKISLTDDTTGETVWRANYNDLLTY